MKKIIITGAAGLVGMNLLTLLDRKKYFIYALDKNKTNLILAKKLFPEITAGCVDLAQNFPNKIFKDADIVIQLHAQISAPTEQPYIDNNITAVKNVLQACKKYNIKHLIHLSSSVVISVGTDNYTNTKRIGEKLVTESGVPHTILRPPLMYGCFDVKHLGFITSMIEKIPLIFPIPGNGKYLRQPLYVNDLCTIIIKLIEDSPQNTVYNIIGKENIYFIDLLHTICEKKLLRRLFIKLPIPLFILLLKTYSFITRSKPFIPAQLHALTAGDHFPVTDWDTQFGITYTPFREGLQKTYSSPYYEYRKEMQRPE